MNGHATPQPDGNVKTAPTNGSLSAPIKPSSTLQINIPQADVIETTFDRGGPGQRMKSPLMKGRRTPLSGRPASRPR